MGIFNKNEGLKVVEHVKKSFEKVKNDFSEIVDWLHYFHKKHEQHDIRLRLVENQMAYMPKNAAEIRQIIDQHYSHTHLTGRIQRLHKKIENLNGSYKPVVRRLNDIEHSLSREKRPSEEVLRRIQELHNRLESIEIKSIAVTPARNQLREKIIEKVTRNSKRYVKSAIVSLMQKYGNVTGLQLKNIVVDEQGLCSRSSFYRLLSEVEQEHPINFTWKGKEKHYLIELSTIKR